MNKSLLIALLAVMPLIATSQTHWEYGLQLGIMSYEGDLSHANMSQVKYSHPAYGLSVSKYLTPIWAMRIEGTYGHISGNDTRYNTPAWHQRRKFAFESPVFETSMRIEWDMLGSLRFRKDEWNSMPSMGTYYSFHKVLSPYLFAGLGANWFDPTTTYNQPDYPKSKIEINTDRTADKSQGTFAVPFGTGLRYDINKQLVVGIEGTYYYPFSDYLDGISLSGNKNNNDWYGTALVTMRYRNIKDDRDADGIIDEKDACPNVAGTAENKGCPNDSDMDGTPDKTDKCPMSKGLAEFAGCPDSDADGIEDRTDACPSIPGIVKFNGCPDTDQDGISDNLDQCPYIKGEAKYDGCPDTDGDGIEDAKDDCPIAAGQAAYKGCPDTDFDGIADNNDECPTAKGDREYKGCPDTDGDGIEDRKDACVLVRGEKKYDGCPDTDGDGIEDRKDFCPLAKGELANGCPDLVKEAALREYLIKQEKKSKKTRPQPEEVAQATPAAPKTKAIVSGPGEYTIYFNVGSATLTPESVKTLNNIVATMNSNRNYQASCVGHTDGQGSDALNLQLSEKRVDACTKYLLDRDVLASYQYMGESSPSADNNDPNGRKKNRRVVITIQ